MILLSQDGLTAVPIERVMLDIHEVTKKRCELQAIPLTEDTESYKYTILGEYGSSEDAKEELQHILTAYQRDQKVYCLEVEP